MRKINSDVAAGGFGHSRVARMPLGWPFALGGSACSGECWTMPDWKAPSIGFNWFKATKARVMAAVRRMWRVVRTPVAHIFRHSGPILLGLAVLGSVAIGWHYWPRIHHPAERHGPLFRPPHPPPNAMHRLFPRNADKNSPNEDFYYLVNILFVPTQTMLVLLAGFFGWRTLSQGHKFKQHDVEARCMKDFLDIERQLEEARTNDEIKRAVRLYWVLMLYEYYWWRQDLVSRDLFTNWCEYQRQRFAKNMPYPDKRGTPLGFDTYIGSYITYRKEKIFPRDSGFDHLMRHLINRRSGKRPVTWYEIEHFRHGWARAI
jgi:hypothetical protein